MTDIKQLAEVCDLVQTEGESQTDTLAADADGWIPWNATADGVSPVPGKTKVSVRLKDGDVLRSAAENFSWVSGQCIPIVAYKILDAALANFATSPEMQYLDPEDCVMPDPDPALLASANRMLHDRLERVAHVLRGCGLPALADVGHEDLQMAAAALSGAYQMALADAAAVPDLRNTVTELEATVALQHETLVTAAADVSRLSAELATERQAREALQEQAGTVEAVGYFVTSASHGPRYFSKRENAIRDAMKNARLGWCARVIPAGKPIGVARKGAEWRAA